MKVYNMATQTRITSTKSILDSMKNIKMMGLVNRMEAKIRGTREDEMQKFKSFNWLIFMFNVSGKCQEQPPRS
jgi:ATP-binding cassette, subfamily C (CFTR/MRP), member 1